MRMVNQEATVATNTPDLRPQSHNTIPELKPSITSHKRTGATSPALHLGNMKALMGKSLQVTTARKIRRSPATLRTKSLHHRAPLWPLAPVCSAAMAAASLVWTPSWCATWNISPTVSESRGPHAPREQSGRRSQRWWTDSSCGSSSPWFSSWASSSLARRHDQTVMLQQLYKIDWMNSFVK